MAGQFVPPPSAMATEQPRPTMRRKSSAQNLLSSFKSNPPPPPPVNTTGLPFASGSGSTPTPTSTRPGEWDVQSLYSESAASSATMVTGTANPAMTQQSTSLEYLRDIVQKRIITLTYMRSVHEGRSHWFHTIQMTRADLERVFNNQAMKKRTYRFAILGMSLSNLLDIHQPQDLLRGLLNAMIEYDQWKEDNEKPKMRLFRSKMAKRQAAGGFADYTMSYNDSSETSYLITPHMPFPLDYHQTLLSLLDVLSECYNKISKILGPSPFSHSQHMMGPLGLLSPHPGVSYLFSEPQHSQQTNGGDGSLWGIATATGISIGSATPGTAVFPGPLGSPPPSWTAALGETVIKIDARFKKITSTLLKELDAFARNGIKDELASLDPLLRNVAVTDDGREQFDFGAV